MSSLKFADRAKRAVRPLGGLGEGSESKPPYAAGCRRSRQSRTDVSCVILACLEARLARPLASGDASRAARLVAKVWASAEVIRGVAGAVVSGDQRQGSERCALVEARRADRAQGALDRLVCLAEIVESRDACTVRG